MSERMVTAFRGLQQLATGPLRDVAQTVWRAVRDTAPAMEAVLIFDDETGRVVDLEMRGDESDMLAHLDATSPARSAMPGKDDGAAHSSRSDGAPAVDSAPRGRGRPRLGVVAREVTLLPRHWEWLASQPGGASVALRRLVDGARRTHAAEDRANASRDAAFRFMTAMAGDLVHFEEAIRALYRHDEAQFRTSISTWPTDIRAHAARLAFPTSENPEHIP